MKPGDIPGYEIMERVGRGGMAEVWKARQLSLDRLVAIKILTTQALPDQEALNRFHVETRAAARLNHQGIVQVYDAGEISGVPYYAMEFVEGRTVGDLLEEHGRLDWDTALTITECVAQGLAHAWDKAGIIHLDIKPDNILAASDGSIKITDLGLARITEALQDENSDLVLGTPNYTSPEQAMGKPDLDCRSDIYSLGAMLYHLVTGVLPFAGARGSEAMDKHVNAFLPDPIDVNAAIPLPVAWLVEKMMVKDRDLRPQDWKAILHDLRLVRERLMPDAPLPEEGRSTVKRSRKRTVPAAAPAGAAPAPAVVMARRRMVKPAGRAGPAGATAPGVAPRRGYAGPSVLNTFILLMLVAGGLYTFILTRIKPGPIPSIKRNHQAPANPAAVATQPAPAPAGPARPPVKVKLFPDPPAPAPTPTRTTAVAPVQPAPAPPNRTASSGETAAGWDDADFVEGAKLYNQALESYQAFQATRQNREALTLVEQQCRGAIAKFQSCRGRAPAGINLDRHISDCYHLISDVRQSTRLGGR